VPVEVEPPELARLLDFAECGRAEDWSLRAALVRYAQPEPERAAQILEVVRRADAALRGHARLFERDGPTVWAALTEDAASAGVDADVIGLLRATAELDRLGDLLATWAIDRAGERPVREVDEITADVGRRLDLLGVAREQRERPPSRRGG
jgi:hypothetical protein